MSSLTYLNKLNVGLIFFSFYNYKNRQETENDEILLEVEIRGRKIFSFSFYIIWYYLTALQYTYSTFMKLLIIIRERNKKEEEK